MSVLNLARGLKTRGHDVTVGFGEGEFLPRELAAANIPYTKFSRLKRTHNPLANLFFIGEIKKYLDVNRFDVIHINSSNALTAGLGAKISATKPKTIFTFRGLSLLDPQYRKNTAFRFFYRLFFAFFLKFIDEPVFVSRTNLDYALSRKIVTHGHVIHNGLDPQKLNFLQSASARNELENISNLKSQILNLKFVIGSIGRLDYAKNYQFLINIFPEIIKIKKDAVCVIIGEGTERKKYEALINRLNLRESVILAGEIEEASKYIKAFDVFVLPSRYEGLSVTLIETLFAGVPVLAARVGGNAELLASDDQLYDLDNKQEFLKKFSSIINNPELRQKLSDQNIQTAEKFRLEKTVKGYLGVYKIV